jgi:hypothetical protein
MRGYVLPADDATILRDLVAWGVLPRDYAEVYGSAALDAAMRRWCDVRPSGRSLRGRMNAPAGRADALPNTPQRAAAAIEACDDGGGVRAADVEHTMGLQMDAWGGVLVAYDIWQFAEVLKPA